MDLTNLRRVMRDAGVRSLYAKRLAANDNSKNQVYLAKGDLSVLNVLPLGPFFSDQKKPEILKAKLDLCWLTDSGTLVDAPRSQLILYPQYPEVRLSGFLMGSHGAPSKLMNSRLPGRILLLGVTAAGSVVAHVVAGSPLAREIDSVLGSATVSLLAQIPLDYSDPRSTLVAALREIVTEGWVESHRLDSTGTILACGAPNCVGLTLEAKLGVRPNSMSHPDFHGWEIKAHSVPSFAAKHTGAITLMTPEPTGGFYKTAGVEAFIRRFGYPDKMGRPDRLNFGGVHAVGSVAAATNLTLLLDGYDSAQGKITDFSGAVVLATRTGEPAAIWKYADLLTIWNRKHAFAAFVAALHRKEPRNQYRYGPLVRLGEGTDFLLFLKAMAQGRVYYDPGLKLEKASAAAPTRPKTRSQFRIHSGQLAALYHAMSTVDVLAP